MAPLLDPTPFAYCRRKMWSLDMKKLIAIAILLLAILSLNVRPAFAVDEAGAAATLAYRLPDIAPDARIARLQAFLNSYDSPLAGEAATFIQEADKNGLDWKLVAAIAGVESTFGKEIPTGSYNAWGWGVFTGATDGVHFNGWADGIAQVSEGLRTNYYGRGAQSIYDVGWMYAANGDSWGTHVHYFIDKLDAFEPTAPDQLAVSI